MGTQGFCPQGVIGALQAVPVADGSWRNKRQLLPVILPVLLPDLRLQNGEHLLAIKLFFLHLFVRLVPKAGNTSKPAFFGAIPLFAPFTFTTVQIRERWQA